MAQIYTPITLDTVRPNMMVPYITKEGDSNSRFIHARITNNGAACAIEAGQTVRGNFVNAEGDAAQTVGGVYGDGTVWVPVPGLGFIVTGPMRCSITMSGTSDKLTTTHFDMFVESQEPDGEEYTPEEVQSYMDQIDRYVADAFTNLVQTSGQNTNKIMSQKAVTDFVNSHGGGGGGASWTDQQITMLETVFAGLAYTNQTAQDTADSLITSLRGSAPVTMRTVTFNMNGHGTNYSVQVQDGQKVTQPANPSATGWSFGGWYTNQSTTTAYNFNTAVTANITLYAKWTATGTTYSVTYNLTHCTSTNTATTVASGETYTTTVTANSGYTLTGAITCTMGGVSQTVGAGGVINIAAVNGDIAITATAEGGGEYDERNGTYTVGASSQPNIEFDFSDNPITIRERPNYVQLVNTGEAATGNALVNKVTLYYSDATQKFRQPTNAASTDDPNGVSPYTKYVYSTSTMNYSPTVTFTGEAGNWTKMTITGGKFSDSVPLRYAAGKTYSIKVGYYEDIDPTIS